MRVLLTNNALDYRAGTELYVRDVALELMRRGHRPVAYSTKLGAVAEELRAATIPVIDRLSSLAEAPDIIHGHHHYETLSALLRFPTTPAIYYCHGWLPWQEAALKHPNVIRYVAVDDLCRERLTAECGIPAERIEVILNFFDHRLFPARSPLPPKPKRALAFGNDFNANWGISPLREACNRMGIELDVCGLHQGNSAVEPGRLIARYDLVFAKARAAIEALAVGAAVVLCAHGRLGPMVTTRNFASLRRLNFGIRTLTQPLDRALLEMELDKYNCEDAAGVSQWTRTECELQPALDRIVNLYQRVLEEAPQKSIDPHEAGRAAVEYLESWAARYKGQAHGNEMDGLREHVRHLEESLEQCTARLEDVSRISEERAQALHDTALQRDAERSSAAETVARFTYELQGLRSSAAETVARLTYELQDLRSSAAETVARLAYELQALRSSASWQWSQRVLQSSLVQTLFGPLIRSVAENRNHLQGSSNSTGLDPEHPALDPAAKET